MVSTQLSINIKALPAVRQSQRISGALRDMSTASDKATSSLGFLDKQFGKFGRFAGPAGLAFEGITEVFDQSRALTETALENANRLERLSRFTDISPETLQTLERFGLSQGVGRGELGEVLQGFTVNLGKALTGSEESAGAFEDLGFTMEALREGAKNADTFLLEVLSRLQMLETAAERGSIANRVIGSESGGRAAVGLATTQSDVRALVLGENRESPKIRNETIVEGATASREFAIAQTDFAVAAQSGALEASAGSLIDLAETLQEPAFTRGAEGLGTAAGSIIELAASGADVALENVAPVLSRTLDTLERIIERGSLRDSDSGSPRRRPVRGVIPSDRAARDAELIEELAAQDRDAVSEFTVRTRRNLGRGTVPRTEPSLGALEQAPEVIDTIVGKFGELFQGIETELDNFLERLEAPRPRVAPRGIGGRGDTDGVSGDQGALLQEDLLLGGVGQSALLGGSAFDSLGQTTLERVDAQQAAEARLSALQAEVEAIEGGGLRALESLTRERQRAASVEAFREQLLAETAGIEGQVESVDRLTARFAFLSEARDEALAKSEAQVEQEERLNRAVEQLGFTFTSAFEDAVIEGQRLSDVLQGLGDDIQRVLLRSFVTEPLLGGLKSGLSGLLGNSGIGGGSDLLDGLFSTAGASAGLSSSLGNGALSLGVSGGSPGVPLDAAVGLASGGLIRGPGSGTSDSILATLSNGEFVVNAAATERFLPLLEAINEDRLEGFQAGGLFGDSLGSQPGAGFNLSRFAEDSRLPLESNSNSAMSTADSENLRFLAEEARRQGRRAAFAEQAARRQPQGDGRAPNQTLDALRRALR